MNAGISGGSNLSIPVRLRRSRGLVGERSRTQTRGNHASIVIVFPTPKRLSRNRFTHRDRLSQDGVNQFYLDFLYPGLHQGLRHGGQVFEKLNGFPV